MRKASSLNSAGIINLPPELFTERRSARLMYSPRAEPAEVNLMNETAPMECHVSMLPRHSGVC